MLQIIRNWLEELFSEEETVVLLLLLVAVLVLLLTLGNVLGPVIVSLIFAYMMQGIISTMMRLGAPHWRGLTVAFLLFLGISLAVLVGLLPLVWQQLTNLVQEMPGWVRQLQKMLLLLPERSELITEAQIREYIGVTTSEIGRMGQKVLSFSIAQIPNLVGLVIYLVLVPILVFFFLKDKDSLLAWLASFLPRRRPLMNAVWHEMNAQMANYVRGKGIEILIIGGVSYLSFALMGLNYAALLALLVGLSVVIPYIGAAVVTIPVLLVGYMQWGWTSEFFTLFFVYAIIQALDGNVLVPLLFSEAVNMHPVAIILSVLIFGGLWGIWGVFFAIPLATLVKAILNSWPTPSNRQTAQKQ